MAEPTPLRVAAVGLGRWAQVIAAGVGRSEALELVSCFSRDPQRREAFAEAHGCRAATTLSELLADPDIEGVTITTPNDTHAELIEQAAAAGKHVFTEKPIANTLADGQRIVEACQRAGVCLAVGHAARYAGPVRALQRLLDDGTLGEVSLIEANFSNDRGLELTPERWRWFRDRSPGGPLIQLAVHHLDTLLALFGPVASVAAQVRRLHTAAEVDDLAVLVCAFDRGPVAAISSSWATAETYSLNVYGTHAAAFYSVDLQYWNSSQTDAHSTLQLQRRGSSQREPLGFEGIDMYRAELEDWANAVRTGAAPTVGGTEALAALALVWAALESSDSGRTVALQTVYG